ncbi:MAG: hypothetical protein ACR2FH_01270 [Caulobacteraceae bacterium]
MPQGKSLVLAAITWAGVAVSAVAGSAPGLTFAGPSPYVASVEVVQHDSGAPPGFADGLRAAVLAEAALYGVAGQPLILRIEVDKVHLKNAAKAMLTGDDNAAKGHVVVIDASTGATLGSFAVRVNASRGGINGGAVAMTLLGALDPTGYVDVATTAAAAGSGTDRSGAQARMSANFAAETLRQTFGGGRARAVHSPKK